MCSCPQSRAPRNVKTFQWSLHYEQLLLVLHEHTTRQYILAISFSLALALALANDFSFYSQFTATRDEALAGARSIFSRGYFLINLCILLFVYLLLFLLATSWE